ncbi:MAG: M20/M25/M40 family metallo-hydrolase [Alphaproteobacteria bacterium]|nr:M20/M25/M40 family metallo-hydrolase [Alphaproteobacteria bacterium]MBU1513042.1 M20/M25/M40 family metallo-hydrolase [Alphaproteobacteria bacterium]MBU2095150.1 M20/M25/M40 family metallo-hydrolase [Alphaproteobacteria bacterium]MBU2152109.1 M20/M25/M40 family metallo-hydrolase [Alphaproteobacteria bacterium]MBU2306401.1 M20/M25/M40 family metallo-hydrolase [Alphaproteobacteria bacterium]
MRILPQLAFAAALVAVSPAFAAEDLAAGAAAVRDKALTDTLAWDITESLTSEVGGRMVGSPAMERARDWGVAKLKALGFENVKVEAFTTPAWSRGAESAEVVGPWPHKLAIIGLGNSAPTAAGGITAPIVVFKTYQAMLDQAPGSLTGKIAVVTQAMGRTQDGSSYGAVGVQRRAGALEAAKRGAVGYLIRSISTDDTRLPHTGGGAAGGIPAAALSPPDAELLENLAGRGKPVLVKLEMASATNPAAPAWNVSGEIRGKERPDEVIVVGGHLDSWDPGTGAIDDAAGIAITTAAAKLAAGPGKPRRTIRVVMWGSEEQGGSSGAYAAAHKDEVAKIIVAGESDGGAGRIWSLSTPPAGAGHDAMKAFRATLPKLKVAVSSAPPRSGGADISGIIGLGVPFVDFNQDMSRYFDLHHSADDTLDKIDPAELSQNVAVWAAFLYTVANSDIDFRAKPPAEAK